MKSLILREVGLVSPQGKSLPDKSILSAQAISQVPKSSVVSERLDKVGASASAICAVHCAIMPFVLTVLPLIGMGFLANEWVEWVLLLTSVTLATSSLCLGYREHRSRRPLTILSVGVTMLLVGRLTEHYGLNWGAVFAVCGGLSLTGAHVLNRMLCRSCCVCSHDGCESVFEEDVHAHT